MAVVPDILATYRTPRAVMRRLLAMGVREDRALAILMAACALFFVAQWPRISREAHLDPSVPLDARMAGSLLAIVFIAPLLFYALGAISHLVARGLGGKGTFFSARLALFWALLATAPLMLFQGLISGFIGPGAAALAVGLGVLAAFLTLWALCLYEAEHRPAEAHA